MAAQLAFDISPSPWMEVRDGDPTVRAMFDRHYSRRVYRDGRTPSLFVGPGEKIVLRTPDARAAFVWRKFRSLDTRYGHECVNCAMFRNEGPVLSSDLIRSACAHAWACWPGALLYTYVDPRRIRSTNPGACFRHAGWRRRPDRTLDRGLVTLELAPP